MRRLLPLVLLFVLWVPAAAAWTWPVDGPVVQGFAFDPDHPYAGGQHRGIDIGASASGIPVLAPAAGTVTYAGTIGANGKSVTIATADGLDVTLTHLGDLAVARDDVVAEGQTIGTVGPSGTPEVDGPYVHLGIRLASDTNSYLDPISLLPVASPPATDDGSTGDPSGDAGAPAQDPAPPADTTPTDTTPTDTTATDTTPTETTATDTTPAETTPAETTPAETTPAAEPAPAQPESAPQADPAPQPEPAPQSQPQPAPQAQPQPEPAPQAQPEPDSQPAPSASTAPVDVPEVPAPPVAVRSPVAAADPQPAERAPRESAPAGAEQLHPATRAESGPAAPVRAARPAAARPTFALRRPLPAALSRPRRDAPASRGGGLPVPVLVVAALALLAGAAALLLRLPRLPRGRPADDGVVVPLRPAAGDQEGGRDRLAA
ncbi:MAG TPA: peptidoglycan DD-metalloendopeptidase family protein [Gaiellaceae bacterium]|nr:peptidoglycan DD-metalloendopeptidase family protein [Gaiellaceae bacterium]